MSNERENSKDSDAPEDELDSDAPEQLAPSDSGDDGDILDDVILPDAPDAPTPF
jgi:hypothetical protein